MKSPPACEFGASASAPAQDGRGSSEGPVEVKPEEGPVEVMPDEGPLELTRAPPEDEPAQQQVMPTKSPVSSSQCPVSPLYFKQTYVKTSVSSGYPRYQCPTKTPANKSNVC